MRNEKGEDWSKYLKEINKLTPFVNNHMNGGSSVPILNTRQAARAAGFKNQADAERHLAEQQEKEAAIEHHKAYLINQWYNQQFSGFLPVWFLKVVGPRMWALRCLGFSWGMLSHTHKEASMPQRMPATWVWLKWLGLTLAKNRLVWDNPGPSKKKIITLP